MARIKEAHALRRDQVIALEVLSLAQGGAGVAKVGGVPVFIERSAPGDKVQVRLFDVRKDFARGAIEQIDEPSTQRQTPPCFHFERCGGCQWQHIDYAHQASAKEDLVRQALVRLGGYPAELIESITQPIISATETGTELRYRNKAQFPVKSKQGQILAGYFERGSHDLVNIDRCVIQPEQMDKVLHALKALLTKYRLTAYSEEKHRGLVRHINLRQSATTGGMLVTIILNYAAPAHDDLNEREELQVFFEIAEELLSEMDFVEGFALNFNPDKGNRIMGDVTVNVAGRGYIEEVLKTNSHELPEVLRKGLTFKLSAESFFQVNTRQSERMLEEIAHMTMTALGSRTDAIIVDAYAGVGTIALWLSSFASEVYAIEENALAVEDGLENARINGLRNLTFEAMRVEDALDNYIGENKVDVLVLDPPRKGVDISVLRSIKQHGPDHLIYVSCNPTTLARDLKILREPAAEGEDCLPYGYKVLRVQPLDMFAQTYHVETICLLKRIEYGALGHLAKE